ncbi:MAG: ribbon-helix-helix domain-containing protein [Treponema sp.]|nr:ribbon-helix-helix domain-containing protein [Treponema sp.]
MNALLKTKPGVNEVITTARLPAETRNKLIVLARLKNKTKSEIIIESLERYYEQEEENGIDSYTLGLPYFGKYNSGAGDLSTTYKQRIKEKIHARQNSY